MVGSPFHYPRDIGNLQRFLVEMRHQLGQGAYFKLGDLLWRMYYGPNNFDAAADIRLWRNSAGGIDGFVFHLQCDGNPEFFLRPELYDSAIAGDMLAWALGRADADGFYVQESNFDSFQSQNAGDNGVEIRGSVDYQGWFDGNIYVTGSCAGCVLASFGLNAGSVVLEPGDAVTVRGVGAVAALADTASPLIEVDRAQDGEAVIGVVVGRAELDVDDGVDPGSEGTVHLVPREGPAKPGAYVTIVTHGPVQVRVSAAQPAIQSGARLAVGETGGVRSLRTVTVDGVQLTEDGPSLGLALESFDGASSEDRIWVLVNPR